MDPDVPHPRTLTSISRETLNPLRGPFDKALQTLARRQAVERLWAKDPSLWPGDSREISRSLGWLEVMGEMGEERSRLETFRDEVWGEGFTDAVLLGMGGSSLGAEVLRHSRAGAGGPLRLHVLDSTLPAVIRGLESRLDLPRTLFLVASKSGTTLEVRCLLAYFWHRLEQMVGRRRTAKHFAAITDPGTPLAALARERHFRRLLLNPPEMGGRYSVLSHFGLVPGVLLGLDLGELLARAEAMATACGSTVPPEKNPGARLGALLGAAALAGRPRLTLSTSPRLARLALWVEQLVAESTGKGGRGIIPVVDEPYVQPEVYGQDRLFVALRWRHGANRSLNRQLEGLVRHGHSVAEFELEDLLQLGGEFFRWQFATALAGSLLEINPFNQPDVKWSKEQTDRVLAEAVRRGRLPSVPETRDLPTVLRRLAPSSSYVALMVYLPPSLALEAAIGELRRRILHRFGVATTCGYGPRLLHSTGQLHKGGPSGGLFLQLVGWPGEDLPIPGYDVTFATLVEAQARGDLLALQTRGRRCWRIDLGMNPAAEVARLARIV